MRFERDRKGIGAFGHALDHRRIDSVLYRKWLERGAGHDGLADDHMLPRQHSALTVVADLGAMQVHRPIGATAHVVFAGPHQLHRPAAARREACLRDLRSLEDEVGIPDRTTSEAPPAIMV